MQGLFAGAFMGYWPKGQRGTGERNISFATKSEVNLGGSLGVGAKKARFPRQTPSSDSPAQPSPSFGEKFVPPVLFCFLSHTTNRKISKETSSTPGFPPKSIFLAENPVISNLTGKHQYAESGRLSAGLPEWESPSSPFSLNEITRENREMREVSMNSIGLGEICFIWKWCHNSSDHWNMLLSWKLHLDFFRIWVIYIELIPSWYKRQWHTSKWMRLSAKYCCQAV